MSISDQTSRALLWGRRRAAGEEGFTMLLAIGILSVCLLLAVAGYTAVQGDVHVSQHDLDGKRAYAAAEAAANAYLYQLNQNPNFWSTCANDYLSITAVPGSTSGEQYSWQPILANGSVSCTSDVITSLIDRSTGTLRIEFSGYSGTPQVQRTIVASFRKNSPFDFLWYTVYEASDPGISSNYSGCAVFLRTGTRPSQCNINWITGDVINGPMYTQDQYLIYGSPTFGRTPNDQIASAAPGTAASTICGWNNGSGITLNNCGSATINGTPQPSAPTISPPTSNAQLLTDANNYGKTYTGTTTIVLNGTQATVTNCPSSCSAPVSVNIAQYPIIYVSNGSSCTPYTYTPFSVSYPTSGCTGDVYVQGSYSTPITIAAANNIIINGPITTTETGGVPSGNATLGLVANEFIRVMHGENYDSNGNCTSDIGSQTFSNMHIDAAMLAVQHSFIVDNYNCGNQLGNLTVNGTIAQYFRGPVGTTSGGQGVTGYLKNYSYDNRLAVLLPPYLFDIATSGWRIARQTLCTPGSNTGAGCNA
jgi:Tfp pilus assembly protein PilX